MSNELRKYDNRHPPVPFDEKDIEKNWKIEKWDTLLPSPGFITDLVLTTRGIETPTKFAVWSAIFGISALLQRDVWLKWFPGQLYPNMYIILVAPPRICAKSTAVRIIEKSLFKGVENIVNRILRSKKKLNVIHSKTTPEALAQALIPEKLLIEEPNPGVLTPDGEEVTAVELEGDSKLTIIASELSTFLGKQQYNIGLVDKLTDLYDCKDIDEDRTVGRGVERKKNIYVTFFGATTPDGLKMSIPEEALGGGFASRSIIIHQSIPTRYHPLPDHPKGAPNEDELGQRLAWIAENAIGEYTLSKEAYRIYCKWYRSFKDSLVSSPDADIRARMDTNLLKLALIIRAQRYEPGNVITEADFTCAMNLLNDVYVDAGDLILEVGTSEWGNEQAKIKRLFKKKKSYSQAELWRMFIKLGIPEANITAQINQLKTAGKLETKRGQGGTLIYRWLEEEEDNSGTS